MTCYKTKCDPECVFFFFFKTMWHYIFIFILIIFAGYTLGCKTNDVDTFNIYTSLCVFMHINGNHTFIFLKQPRQYLFSSFIFIHL